LAAEVEVVVMVEVEEEQVGIAQAYRAKTPEAVLLLNLLIAFFLVVSIL
jgi:hypothetical protein